MTLLPGGASVSILESTFSPHYLVLSSLVARCSSSGASDQLETPHKNARRTTGSYNEWAHDKVPVVFHTSVLTLLHKWSTPWSLDLCGGLQKVGILLNCAKTRLIYKTRQQPLQRANTWYKANSLTPRAFDRLCSKFHLLREVPVRGKSL